jgi:hypothetical protein
VAIFRDADLRPLADDLPAQPYPAGAAQLERQARPLGQRSPEGGRRLGGLEDEEERPGPAGECDEAGEPVGEARLPAPAIDSPAGGRRPRRGPGWVSHRDGGRPRGGPAGGLGQVQNQDVHDPALEERAGHGKRLVERGRGEDGEPLEAHAPADRLDRVEAPREVDPGGQRTPGLGLGHRPQSERGRPARSAPPEDDRAGPWQAAAGQESVQLGEAGGDRPADGPCRLPGERPGRSGLRR